MSKTFNKNIPYTFTGAIVLPTSSNLNITSNSNTIGNIFTTGGNIGIGTSLPAYTLDINGTFRSNNLTYLTSTTSVQVTTNNYSLTSGSLNVSGDIVLSGTEIMFTQTNISPPTMNSRSTGTKIVLYPSQQTGFGDYSVGVENFNTWFQVPNNNAGFKFYQGTTASMVIATNGNVGINTTRPTHALSVNGSVHSMTFNPIIDQGAYLQWNRSDGGGETWLINQRGIGTGNSIRFGSAATSGNTVTEWWRFDGNNLTNRVGDNIFIDSAVAPSQFVFGYNTPRQSGQEDRLQVYNNATDRSLHFRVASRGTSSGSDFVESIVPFRGIHNSNTIGSLFTTGGNLGIRTTSPVYTLDITGTYRINGTNGVNVSIHPSNGSFGTIECFTSGNTAKLPLCLNPYGGLVGIGTTAAQSSFTTTLNNCVHISGPNGALDNTGYGCCQIVLNDTDIASRSHLTLIRSGQSVSYFRVNTSNQLVISMAGGGVYLANNATSWTAVSDRRMKTDFVDIVEPLDKLSQIKGTYYRYLTDASDIKRVGVIAQDVQAVLPEAVSEDVDGVLGVSYTDIIPLVIEAIKELKTKNNELQTYIQTLEARLTKLER